MRRVLPILGWLAAGALWVALLAAAAVWVPPQFRPVGLYFLLFALVAGTGLGWLARRLHVAGSAIVFGVACALLIGGEAGLLAGCYRRFVSAVADSNEILREELQQNPAADWDARFREEREQDPPDLAPEAKQRLQQQREEMERAASVRSRKLQELEADQAQRTTFAAYVRHRISTLGDWRSPWPEVFLAAELLCGVGLGSWAACRTAAQAAAAGTLQPELKPIGVDCHE